MIFHKYFISCYIFTALFFIRFENLKYKLTFYFSNTLSLLFLSANMFLPPLSLNPPLLSLYIHNHFCNSTSTPSSPSSIHLRPPISFFSLCPRSYPLNLFTPPPPSLQPDLTRSKKIVLQGTPKRLTPPTSSTQSSTTTSHSR